MTTFTYIYSRYSSSVSVFGMRNVSLAGSLTPSLILIVWYWCLGNILQIVSAPGQQIIRPQGSMVMQAMPQAVPVSNASATPGTPHHALSPAQQGDYFEMMAFKSFSCYFTASLLDTLKNSEKSVKITKQYVTICPLLTLWLEMGLRLWVVVAMCF